MPTVTQLKTRLQRYLNRSDTALTDIDDDWLTFAHREIQRRHNFKGQETIASLTLVAGTSDYSEPTVDVAGSTIVMKEFEWVAYPQNPSTGVIGGSFFEQTGYQNIVDLRAGDNEIILQPGVDPEKSYFAWHESKIKLWPTPSTALVAATSRLRMPGWKFLPLPADGSSDWFTNNTDDYIIYRALLESVAFFGSPDTGRVKLWEGLAERAWNTIQGFDVQAAHAGPLRARG